MTTIRSSPSKPMRPNGHHHHNGPNAESKKAQLFLILACVWPLCLLALFTSSAPHAATPTSNQEGVSPHRAVTANLGFKFRDVLDRVDVIGYGPTHPRVAIVLVGDDRDKLVATVESVFGNTDMNRIFMVVVIVDGIAEDEHLKQELRKIDTGKIPHWHGLRPDLHTSGTNNDNDEEDPHGRKVHVVFNDEKRGIAECRKDAIDFIRILEKHHEEEGLKSTEEDLILLLLESGAQLTSHKWLGPVTEALIVPPPILGKHDSDTVAFKLANAVSFNFEGMGKTTSFDSTFTRVISEPKAEDINLSNGDSYPTPALNGVAVALRLNTYTNLPQQDLALKDSWSANLDLALNLWLCADGIDILKDLEITAYEQAPPAPMPPAMAARFAAAWMDDVTQKKFFNIYRKQYEELTYLEWETYMATATTSPNFTKDLTTKCRSFQWYAEHINMELADIFSDSSHKDNNNDEVADSRRDSEVVDDESDPENNIVDLPNKPLPIPGGVNDDEDEEDGPDLSIPDRRDGKKPSKPLCEECLQIVQKAEPVDITYVDVSDGHKEHPHLGAKDENGNFGYIHDETALRNNPEPYDVEETDLLTMCQKRDNNYKMLNEKVFVDLEYDKQKRESGERRPTIFCLVYTTDLGHSKIPSIRQTWGNKCDGFMVASNRTDPAIGAVDIPHEGPEEYNNIWQKVRSMWSYVYDNYYEKYDWFHIGGDDLYLIVENLRLYLESEEIQTASNGGLYLPDGTEKYQTPLFMGRRFAYQGDMNDIFNSGGSGYTMNKAAVKRLVVDGFPNYFPHAKTFSEDTMIARIFRTYGIYPYETKDETGGERYMPFMPGHHYGYRMPKDHSQDWYAKYSINVKEGVDHCAARSIAFHYVKGEAMFRLHALLYHLCPAETQ